MPTPCSVTVVVGLAAMMGYLALIAHTIGHGLVRAIRQMQLGTELIATVNPGHRLEISTGDELQRLADEINHLADRLATARQDGARAAVSAAAGLEAERTRLADVLDALGDGVLVVTPGGRVGLANRAALALLGEDLLGRDLTAAVVDATRVLRAAEDFRAGARVAHRVTLRTRDGGLLEAVVASTRGERGTVGRARDRPPRIEPRRAWPPIPGATGSRSRGAGFASGAGRSGRGRRPSSSTTFPSLTRWIATSDPMIGCARSIASRARCSTSRRPGSIPPGATASSPSPA